MIGEKKRSEGLFPLPRVSAAQAMTQLSTGVTGAPNTEASISDPLYPASLTRELCRDLNDSEDQRTQFLISGPGFPLCYASQHSAPTPCPERVARRGRVLPKTSQECERS